MSFISVLYLLISFFVGVISGAIAGTMVYRKNEKRLNNTIDYLKQVKKRI